MKKTIFSFVAIALLCTGCGTTSAPTTNVTVDTSTTYTMAQVASANSSAKCWTTVNGKIYDLTTWISQHPGGEGAILSICGKDGASAFDAQHAGQRRPEQELQSLQIGVLAQ